ncbi:Metallophosphoesterase 1 [Desmophyllum pertusum]|uniref:Metallophosphoesterase 1 n=1 Tax=Desmophyllum pertusum TaxID=174260 RepID=A0A9W9YP92_9CNID|nr:Metallophosphoesterase 1 [Desmophyllum pertusum]
MMRTSSTLLYTGLLKRVAIFAVCLFVFCEWFIYYLVIFQCSWPEINIDENNRQSEPLKAMLLTDTHLLGSKDGHWFDKLRREWQMERAFQTALSHFNPDVVFLLGDLFDEGMKCSDEEWDFYIQRFRRMFRHSEHTELHVVVGNHDIGFHPDASRDKHLFRRFSSVFDSPSVELLSIRGNLFVLVNSIALQGDECSMCSEAMTQLMSVADKLNCHRERTKKEIYEDLAKKQKTSCDLPKDSPAPILIQHFPLYRRTEVNCAGADAPPAEEKNSVNREKWEVVSKKMSNKLLQLIRPRLVLSGHTHHGCYLVHDDGTPEMTIPSFSWRNRNNPSFVLSIITPDKFAISKCFIPRETTVIAVYIIAGAVFVLMNLRPTYVYLRSRRTCRQIKYESCCIR